MQDKLIFMLMFGGAVFMLVVALTVPSFGSGGISRKRLMGRLTNLMKDSPSEISHLIRQKKQEKLSPLARLLENATAFEKLRLLIEHSGSEMSVARWAVLSIMAGVAGFVGFLLLSKSLIVAVMALFAVGALPTAKLIRDRAHRIDDFESHLPEAIDVMRRAIQAGYPFTEALRVVADEMDGPVASEFGITFMDINYGASVNSALMAMLERVPSITLMSLVTSIMVQKESGGNLTEILENINRVVRGRFQFQRRVKTLAAEGKFSAWVLALMPFVLFVFLQIRSPKYTELLLGTPDGRELVFWAFGGMMIGILWMRRIIRIEV